MTSQLLIEMPAQGAVRLLTLSLLEQIAQYTAGAAMGDPHDAWRYADTYRAFVRRLRASMSLYADALGESVPRKARRRMRELVDAAERLHRADVQAAWIGRHVATMGQRENDVPLGDGARAAAWLVDRLSRRRERARRLVQRAQSDARPLRRISKRLGVYTTSVRLEEGPAHQSFAAMTSDHLLAKADALGAAIRTVTGPGSHAELRRARRAAEHIGYLLDPLRASTNIEEPSAHLARLRGALDRLDDIEIVGRAIIRGGRRVAAVHAGQTLHDTIWPPAESVLAPPMPPTPSNGRVLMSPTDLQRGLTVLAEALHDDAMHAFDALTAAWQDSGADLFIDRLTTIATQLQD